MHVITTDAVIANVATVALVGSIDFSSLDGRIANSAVTRKGLADGVAQETISRCTSAGRSNLSRPCARGGIWGSVLQTPDVQR